MIRQMERSTIQLLAKRGKSQRQIARELGLSRTTVARALREPVEQQPAPRERSSKADPYRAQIEEWIREGLTTVRMLEMARADAEQPYTGGRTQFGEMVRRVKRMVAQQQASVDVPIRFEGLPAEYLQVDWGEVRCFPFTQQSPATRYFLACRLKYSRWTFVRWTADMKQETLFRGLLECMLKLGWVPWLLVFDNMKTVTSGRDSQGQPVWTEGLLKLSAELGFHPQACDVGAGNQKGSVESLVKWVKGNFLCGRVFVDDLDLVHQNLEWLEYANARPSSATHKPPIELLGDEAPKGGVLPPSVYDYGLFESARVSAESLVSVRGNRYSVPTSYVGMPVTVRLHREQVRLWHNSELVAEHVRVADGMGKRLIVPQHLEPVLERKPKARAMLYRDILVSLGGVAPAFLSALSYRQRARLQSELIGVYELYERHGAEQLLAAMTLADTAGTYSADALSVLLDLPSHLSRIPSMELVGLPTQAEVDRSLEVYEALVEAGR